MSRRRAGEGPLADDEESQAGEGLHAEEAAGKSRTPAERVSRFARQRPVTSLLALIVVCAAGFLVLAVSRALFALAASRGASHDVFIRHAAPDDPSIVDVVTAHDPPPAVAKPGAAAAEDADDASDASDARDARAAADFAQGGRRAKPAHGAVEVAAPAHKAAADPAADAAPRACVRKFAAGKLGAVEPLCVTDEFFFDIATGGRALGTVRIGVFGRVVPKSAANFRALATCTGAFTDTRLCFRGDGFHRIARGFVVQGGSKATGRSIYGGKFREERSKDHHSFLEHGEHGVVAWAEYPIGSQFYILLGNEAKYLDNNHVVFGIVTEGWDVVEQMGALPVHGEQPVQPVVIANCGEVKRDESENFKYDFFFLVGAPRLVPTRHKGFFTEVLNSKDFQHLLGLLLHNLLH